MCISYKATGWVKSTARRWGQATEVRQRPCEIDVENRDSKVTSDQIGGFLDSNLKRNVNYDACQEPLWEPLWYVHVTWPAMTAHRESTTETNHIVCLGWLIQGVTVPWPWENWDGIQQTTQARVQKKMGTGWMKWNVTTHNYSFLITHIKNKAIVKMIKLSLKTSLKMTEMQC